ncbi:uncharacterized protein [Magallana gigas]|uniref:uncharacterized protein n=1 Tax=Magallana gigas TaxID=29159 RepID=UPI00333EB29C
MDPTVLQQLQKMQTVLDSALKDLAALQQENRLLQQQQQIYELKQKSLKEDVQILKTLNQTSQQRIILLENSLHQVQSENQILRDDLNDLNVTSQTGFQELRLESQITNEIVRKIKLQDREITNKVSTSLRSQQLQMRYLSLSLLDMQNQTMAEIQQLTDTLDTTTAKFNASLSHIAASQGPHVAFTAGFSSCCTHTFAVGHPVKFNSVLYQVGGGYDISTGIFTTPRAGLYIIFSTIVAYRRESFWSRIVINGSEKAGMMAYNNANVDVFQPASNLIVQQLQVGDRVWIKLHYGQSLYSDISETTFSVVMINF